MGAAVDNPLVKAFGGIIGYQHGPDAVRQGNPTGFPSKIEQGIQATPHDEATGEVILVPVAAREGDAAMTTSHIVIPVLMVHCKNALSPAWARQLFANLCGPKSELWLTAKSQTEFSDSP